jgi:hypothetical protein
MCGKSPTPMTLRRTHTRTCASQPLQTPTLRDRAGRCDTPISPSAPAWTEFRSAGYNGVTDDIQPGGVALVNSVTQAVARYPDSSRARDAFHQLELTLQACAELKDPNYTFSLDRADSATLRISAEEWSHPYREKSGVLMSVGVVGLEAAPQIATTVIQMISDRVK